MRRNSDQQTRNDTLSRASNQDKNQFVKKKKSGLYQAFDPFTGQLIEQGKYSYGEPVGLWRVIDADGDEQHFQYSTQRVGALCNDGSRSSATGRGACSWHGGVAEWLYQSVKRKVGGTGKYESTQSKIARGQKMIKQKFKLNQTGEQLQYQLTLLILQLDDKNQKLQKSNIKVKTQNEKLKLDLKRTKQQLQEQKKNNVKFTKKKKEYVKEMPSTNQKEKVEKKTSSKDYRNEESQQENQNQKQDFKSILYLNQEQIDQAEQSPSQLQIRTDSDSDLQRDNGSDENDSDQEYKHEVKSKNLIEKTYELRSKDKKQPVKQQIHFRKTQNISKKNKKYSSQQSDSNNQDCDISQAVIKQIQKQLAKEK